MATQPRLKPWMQGAKALSRRVGWDRVLRVLFLFGVSLAIFLAVGRSGFNITDEGLVLDWSYRILHGAIPHRDIMTVHIQGSGLLHIVDLAMPTPVLATSRLIAISEVVAYSAVLAAITFTTPFRRWRLPHFALVVAAVVINLNTFPFMAWYTIDGILFCAVGIYLLTSSPRPLPARRVAVAVGLLGAAAVMKQSFGPATPLAVLTVFVLGFREGWRACLTKSVMASAAGLLPFAAYSAWVGAAGGLPDMIRQLSSATPVWGEQFLHGGTLGSGGPGAVDNLQPLLLLVALASMAVLGGGRLRTSGYPRGRSLQRLGLLVGGGTIVATVAVSRLSTAGVWGLAIEGFLVSWLVLNAAIRFEFDTAAFWFAALGWMVSLSFAATNNDLVAGSIVILLLQRLWAAAHVPTLATAHARPSRIQGLRVGMLLVGLCLLLTMGYQVRQANPYRDLPPDKQTGRPGQIAPAYGWIETGAPTMAYLRQVDDCIAAYPASRISILPDTPTQHVVYDRAAALPVSNAEPTDYRGSETQILEAARKLDAQGDYLILFQSTWDGQGYYKGLPNTTSLGTPVWDYGDHDFYSALQSELTGQRYVCGSLIAVYKPPAN